MSCISPLAGAALKEVCARSVVFCFFGGWGGEAMQLACVLCLKRGGEEAAGRLSVGFASLLCSALLLVGRECWAGR